MAALTLSVIVCTHNPRPDYFRRTLGSLQSQTYPGANWELLVVDNASTEPVAEKWNLSWHPCARHVREETLGLTPARLRAIQESTADLLIFVDDDNVLANDYLERAYSIFERCPRLGVFGAGVLSPEFEIDLPQSLEPYVGMLTVRTVSSPRSSSNPSDYQSLPWGAGLCVRRSVARSYVDLMNRLEIVGVLGRRGDKLFSGEDDVFSSVSTSMGLEFGIHPELRVTHLIGAVRLTESYIRRLIYDHTFSRRIRHFVLDGAMLRRPGVFDYALLPLYGIKGGVFSMRCRWAALRGERLAARFIVEKHLVPIISRPSQKS